VSGDVKPYALYKDTGLSWLGKIPEHWQVMRGKTLFRSIDIRSSTGEEELLTVSSAQGVILRRSANVTMFKAESYVGYKLCWPGDLVINSLWAWAYGLGVSRYHGIVSSAYGVYRLRPQYSTYVGYIHYLVRSSPFQWELQVRSKGIWKSRLQLTDQAFLDIPFPLPPEDEQDAIARFLSHADQRIRRYIFAKQKLIKLLEEQKQAIIERAVTHGLDTDACLKPSGVEWLGDLPQHWEVSRSRRLFSVRTELARPDDVQLSATQAYGVIPQSEFESNVGRKVVRISMHLEKRRHVEKDDFVISMRSFQGGLERAWASGAIRSSYVVLKPNPGVDVDYFAYVFKSRGYIGAIQATADFIRDGQDLTFDNFRRVDLPLIPVEEQRAIAKFITESVQRVDVNRSKLAREIALVREYRTRLITDVVTGRLDVRDAAVNLLDEVEELDDLPLVDDEMGEDIDDGELSSDELGE